MSHYSGAALASADAQVAAARDDPAERHLWRPPQIPVVGRFLERATTVR
jgi:hypothetical protein